MRLLSGMDDVRNDYANTHGPSYWRRANVAREWSQRRPSKEDNVWHIARISVYSSTPGSCAFGLPG